MTQAEYKALFNETIKTWKFGRKRVNLDDALYEAELAEIAKEKHARNGNGSNDSAPSRVKCWCNECLVGGKRLALHAPKDCEYTARRSALVGEAMKITTEKVGDATGRNSLGYAWTNEFNRVMDRLAVEAGLVK